MSLRVYSASRSGHHATLDWLRAHGATDVEDVEDRLITIVDERMVKGRSILLVRDPFNLFASRCKKSEWVIAHRVPRLPQYTAWVGPETVELVVNHLREFVRDTSFLKNVTRINFNRWTNNPTYRAEIGQYLGLGPACRNKWERVSARGRGSSFDGTKKRGSDLAVHERWRQYRRNPMWISMALEPRVVELAEAIWPKLTKRVLSG